MTFSLLNLTQKFQQKCDEGSSKIFVCCMFSQDVTGPRLQETTSAAYYNRDVTGLSVARAIAEQCTQ